MVPQQSIPETNPAKVARIMRLPQPDVPLPAYRYRQSGVARIHSAYSAMAGPMVYRGW